MPHSHIRLRHLTRPAFPLLLALAVATPALAAAQVGGLVRDTSGAAVPGATVTLRRPAVAFERQTVTDATGRFSFEAVPPGDYEIAAQLDGFNVSRLGLRVADAPLAVDLVLEPGSFAEEVTVMGTRLAGSEEMLRRIPGSVDILERTTLGGSAVMTTSEALRKVPGLNLRDEEGLGLRPNIGVRGLNPTRATKVLLLEDGLPLTYAPYGDNASYYHPPIERFERVEVVKGSGQIAYGPSTIGGVINYLTPDPPARRSVAAQLVGGSRAYLNGHLTFGDTWAGHGLLLDAMRKQSDGARENIHSDLTDLTVKYARQLSPRHHLTVKGNYYGERSQVTYSGLRQAEYEADPRQNPFANDRFTGDRAGASAVHRVVLGDRAVWSTTGYLATFSRDWWRQSSNSNQRPNDAADPACGGMANLNTTCGNEGRLRDYLTTGVESRMRVTHRLFGAGETDLGVRLHVEDQRRKQVNGDTPTARSGRLVEDNLRGATAVSGFVQHRLLFGRWTVTPGLRAEWMSYSRTNRLAGARGRTELAELVPGVGVAFAASPQTTLFAGAHRGFAPPRVEDVISNTGGIVDLDPERSWNYELGIRALPAPGVRANATWFRMDYENQIVPASLAGGLGAALTNGGATRHEGVELWLGLDAGTLRGSRHNPYARAAWTWLPTARFTGVRFSNVPGFGTVSVNGKRLPYAPRHLATLTLGYAHDGGFELQLEAQHVGDQFGDDLNTVAPTPDGQRGLVPAVTLWNATVSQRLASRSARVFVAVKNLRDTIAIVDRSRGILPTHPRLVQVGVSWRF
jgi:Fe(3+) dicitrate transport protein